jgi:glycosyltransferase involved in cell wall biosynthesis
MKIAAVLHSEFSSGGAFHQSLGTVQELRRIAGGTFEFVVWTNVEANIGPLKAMGIAPKLFRRTWLDWLLRAMEASRIGQRLTAQFGVLDSLERSLLRDGVDLAYFTSPTSSAARLKRLCFIATVWDLCHRDWPEFPEVSSASEYFTRESLFGDSLQRAQLVITDSDELADKVVRRYDVERDRVLAVPFGPSPLLDAAHASNDGQLALAQYGLQPGYLFYPAQFWSHKNHVRIVQALAQLRDAGLRPVTAFAGSDKGNRSYVESVVRELGLADQVRFLGLVPTEHMRPLYMHCGALVMPTYFGPTNLPPLEAWAMGKPVIYSRHLAHHGGDAAVFVDPDSATSIADAIRSVLYEPATRDWAQAGLQRLSQLAEVRDAAAHTLMQHLERFACRRECWR